MQPTNPKKKTKRRKPTLRQLAVVNKILENKGNVSKAMREAGLSPAYAKNPQQFMESEAVQDLLSKAKVTLSDDILIQRHAKLLNAHKLEHMVFPLGPEDKDHSEDDYDEDGQEGENIPSGESVDLSDEDIIQMLSELGCVVRKIVHSEMCRHVYYWASDNKSQLSALELAYDLRGYLKKDSKAPVVVPVQVNIEETRRKYA